MVRSSLEIITCWDCSLTQTSLPRRMSILKFEAVQTRTRHHQALISGSCSQSELPETVVQKMLLLAPHPRAQPVDCVALMPPPSHVGRHSQHPRVLAQIVDVAEVAVHARLP